MVFFHETLDDVNKKAREGKFVEAKRILDKHINSEHNFQSDLAGLQGALGSFVHELRELQSDSESVLSRKVQQTGVLDKMFAHRVYNAKIALTKVEALIVKLRKDAKFDLR